jgi:hypothetical protein
MTTLAMTPEEMDREIDLALTGSFPASDPPPWTLGAAPEPPVPSPPPAAVAPAAIDVVIAAGPRTGAASMLEALAMTALIPVGVLIVAAPLLLAAWAIAALFAWL